MSKHRKNRRRPRYVELTMQTFECQNSEFVAYWINSLRSLQPIQSVENRRDWVVLQRRSWQQRFITDWWNRWSSYDGMPDNVSLSWSSHDRTRTPPTIEEQSVKLISECFGVDAARRSRQIHTVFTCTVSQMSTSTSIRRLQTAAVGVTWPVPILEAAATATEEVVDQ